MSELLDAIEIQKDKFESDDDFEAYLDEIYGTVSICGLEYNAGHALKEIDPTAFDVAMADEQETTVVWECPICSIEWDDEENALYCCQEEPEEEDD